MDGNQRRVGRRQLFQPFNRLGQENGVGEGTGIGLVVAKRLVEQIIARHPDIRLLTAVNGKGGIDIACPSQPDTILMNINLPGINGFEALKILRSDPATAHIPVIALSANAMPLDIEKGMDAGFFRYITKPIKVKEFMEAIDMAMVSAGKPSEGTNKVTEYP
ncbi:MAG: hybrid sensor histidine kinase/response regulator [Methylovulum miyakonense]|uniref:response regulator n=1 Tax=Methylovulum miyakonense TaxID=645578 RepID=UPI003BB6758E